MFSWTWNQKHKHNFLFLKDKTDKMNFLSIKIKDWCFKGHHQAKWQPTVWESLPSFAIMCLIRYVYPDHRKTCLLVFLAKRCARPREVLSEASRKREVDTGMDCSSRPWPRPACAGAARLPPTGRVGPSATQHGSRRAAPTASHWSCARCPRLQWPTAPPPLTQPDPSKARTNLLTLG